MIQKKTTGPTGQWSFGGIADKIKSVRLAQIFAQFADTVRAKNALRRQYWIYQYFL